MDDREMLEKIAESARHLPTPPQLKPDQIEKRLKHTRSRGWKRQKYAVAAACLCVCFGMAGFVYQNNAKQIQSDMEREMQTDREADRTTGKNPKTNLAENTGKEDAEKEDTGKEDTEKKEEVAKQYEPVKKLGKMYTLASGYLEVYNVLKEAGSRELNQKDMEDVDNADDAAYGGMVREEELQKNESAVSKTGSSDFSGTNLQVEGVDESDFVKTDGRFIYVVQDDRIQILDVRSAVPYVSGTIRPDMDEDTDRICEMYVADRRLTVILQNEKTYLKQQIEAVPITKVVTYDITEPQKPELQHTAVQDGWYKTSRKIGDRLYLFTNRSLAVTDEAMTGKEPEQWLPRVNEKVVEADSIYMQKGGSEGLLMTSLDLKDLSRVTDTKLLIHPDVNLYVSSTSVYLYETVYVNEAFRTRIARFGLEADGTIRAKAAKTLKGSIQDTFAIHEREGYLQVLTSVTNAQPWENRVYVLDENMKTVGKLTGIAPGEKIYAARFTGDIGYFVTYRNTDPLFTVDFSNPKDPQIIGELKVTGFSEYLHFWSDTKLLGIGYETNPDNGERMGIKLSMFDISDPLKVKEEAKLVLKGVSDCAGLNDYKAVLVSSKKNVIAFTTESYDPEHQEIYRAFSYQNGRFVSRVERKLVVGTRLYSYDSRNWRSLYVDDRLYLVGVNKMIVFSMREEWKEIGKLVYGWVDKNE